MSCCALHKLFAREDFGNVIRKDKYAELIEHCCNHIEHRRRKQYKHKDLNSVDNQIYLFKGVTQRHIASLTKQHFGIQPISEEVRTTRPWYPIMTMDTVYVTKSLSYLTRCRLPLALLYMLSYFENYLKTDYAAILSNLDVQMEIPILFYLIHHASSNNLINTLSNQIGLKCDTSMDDDDINNYITEQVENSILQDKNKMFYSYMPHCFQPSYQEDLNLSNEKHFQEWIMPLATFLLTNNWTSPLMKMESAAHSPIAANHPNPTIISPYRLLLPSTTPPSLTMQMYHMQEKQQHQQQQQLFSTPLQFPTPPQPIPIHQPQLSTFSICQNNEQVYPPISLTCSNNQQLQPPISLTCPNNQFNIPTLHPPKIQRMTMNNPFHLHDNRLQQSLLLATNLVEEPILQRNPTRRYQPLIPEKDTEREDQFPQH